MTARLETTDRVQWAPIVVIIIGTFMAILDSSIVNVAIPKMMAVFGASQDSIEWVLTGYMLTLGVVMPLSGYLGDRFGYKRVFMSALVMFIIGSTLCGMAWNVNSLIAARVVQALGGGVMQPLSMALLYRYAPRAKIGMVMGVWGISAMVAPAIGPTLGGYLVDFASWRMIFYINLPIGILNLFLASVNLRETELVKGKTLDKMGIVLSSTGFFCLLMALSKGVSKGWTSPFIILMIATGVLSLAAFVLVELRHPEPILELRLFTNFTYAMSIIISSIISIGLFGGIFLIPIYLQNILGVSAMKSGLLTLPFALASGFMMPISGRIFDKYGARPVAIVGLSIVTITTYMAHVFDLQTPFLFFTVLFTIRGVGMGLCNMPVNTAGMNTVPPHLIGRASALGNVIRQVAASLGIAMFTTILQHREAYHFASLAQSVNLDGSQAAAIQGQLGTMAASHGLSAAAMQSTYLAVIYQRISLMAAATSIGDCFVVSAIMCLAALLLVPFLRENRRPATEAKKTGLPAQGQPSMATVTK